LTAEHCQTGARLEEFGRRCALDTEDNDATRRFCAIKRKELI